MARYIDAEPKYIDANSLKQKWLFCGKDGKPYRNEIDAMPTADVQEVVHGEWIVGKEIAREFLCDKTLHIDYEDYKCSVCGLTLDRLLYCVDGSLFYKYCPNCGARMDKE